MYIFGVGSKIASDNYYEEMLTIDFFPNLGVIFLNLANIKCILYKYMVAFCCRFIVTKY